MNLEKTVSRFFVNDHTTTQCLKNNLTSYEASSRLHDDALERVFHLSRIDEHAVDFVTRQRKDCAINECLTTKATDPSVSNDTHGKVEMEGYLEKQDSQHHASCCSANDITSRLSQTVLMEEEARLLLSLRYSQPGNLLEMLSGCTAQNIQYILLTQQSVHKLLNLEQILQENGRISELDKRAMRRGGRL